MPSIFHLEGSSDKRFPHFERPALPCPTSTLRTYVKQLAPSTLSPQERNFLDHAFSGFLSEVDPPGPAYEALAGLTPHAHYETRMPRRYAGDKTLPPGRYYSVCENETGADSGTLVHELLHYKSAAAARGHFEIYDPSFPAHRKIVNHIAISDETVTNYLAINFAPFAQESRNENPFAVNMILQLEIDEICVENVLDLRQPAALHWLYQTIPDLQMVLTDTGETAPCFPYRPPLKQFADILPSLLDQQRGGGNFDKLVGLYLRQIGVSGLVFPSARMDAYTYVEDGEVKEYHGWTFLDYRDAPEPEYVGFVEFRPEWPRTLTHEGGDDHEPKPVAFANEFQIHMTEGFPSTGGTLVFRGLTKRTEALHKMYSMQDAIRVRLSHVDRETVETLLRFTIDLGAHQANNFSAMVLYSLLGMRRAQEDLENFVETQLGDHPTASLLRQCANPPPAAGNAVSQAGDVLALFQKSELREKRKQ